MGGCGQVVLMLLAVALLLPGLCFGVMGLGAIPSLIAGKAGTLISSGGFIVVGAGLVAAAVLVFRSVGNAADEDEL